LAVQLSLDKDKLEVMGLQPLPLHIRLVVVAERLELVARVLVLHQALVGRALLLVLLALR